MGPRTAPRGRGGTREVRVAENDARIVHAAGSITAKDGWLGLSPYRVASASGLSRTAVQARYEHDVELAVGVWNEFARESVTTALESLLVAANLLPGAQTTNALAQAMRVLSSNDSHLRAGSELLILAHFHPEVAAAVGDTLGATVRGWLSPARRSAPLAQRAYLLNAGLGLLLASRRTGAGRLDWHPIAEILARGLHASVPQQTPPKTRAPHLGVDLDFGTGNTWLEALLNATLQQVGDHGFDGATTRGIAKVAGVSEGFLFSRYPNKLDLFLDATGRMQALTYPANQAFLSAVAEKWGPGIAEAVTLREMQHPDLARDRALMLEQVRVGWHEPRLGKAQERELAAALAALEAAEPGRLGGNRAVMHYAYALGVGVVLLPLLAPDCWRLPYASATVPLTELGL